MQPNPLRIWSHLLKESLLENFIFCAVLISSFGLLMENQTYTKKKQPPEEFCKKKVFLEISQNSQENISARVSF